jgi:hypothetical protein
MWQMIMSTKNLPVFEDAEKYIYSLSQFLELSDFLPSLRFKKGIITTKVAIYQSLDFLYNLFGLLYRIDSTLKDFKKSVDAALVPIYREFCSSPKLTVDDSINGEGDFLAYYKGNFKSDLINYFDLPVHGYIETISHINYLSVGRWEDGNPSGNTLENMMFSSIFLNLYLAQQAVIKVVSDDALKEFNEISCRPWILTGPGGGDRLFALKALEYAGLLPSKSEVSEYLATLVVANDALNKEMSMALERCSFRQHKEAVLVCLEDDMKDVIELLKDWMTALETTMWEFMSKRNIPTQIITDKNITEYNKYE